MDLESRIQDFLVDEDAGRRDPVDSYEWIVARGKRRRVQAYAGQVFAVVVALGVLIVGTSLFLGRGTPSDPVALSVEADPIDLGGGLLGTLGEIGPAPLGTPSGREIPLLPFDELSAADRARLRDAGENLREDIPIRLVGEITDTTIKVFITHDIWIDEQGSPEDMVCLLVQGPDVGTGLCGPETKPSGEPGLSHLEGDSYLLVGFVPPNTSYVEAKVSGAVVWQRAVSNVIALPLEATADDTAVYTLFNENGNPIMTKSLGDSISTAEWAVVLGDARGRWGYLDLGIPHPAVWTTRLEQICSHDQWDSDVAMGLAEQFIAEDLAALPANKSVIAPTTLEGANALEDIAELACPDILP